MPPPPPPTSPGFLAGRGGLRRLPKERPHLRRCTKIVCSAFLTVLLLAGVLLFVAYLAVRPHRPRFHVAALSAAGLQAAGAVPVLLSGELSLRNPNQDIAFFFDRLYLSVRYRNGDVVRDRDLTAGAPLYQPPKTTTEVQFVGVPVAGGDMARDAAAGGAGGAPLPFTLKLRSRIRVKLAFWGSHWHPLHVSCDVAVGPDGQLLPEYQQKRCGINFL